jgi:hypothetical protein
MEQAGSKLPPIYLPSSDSRTELVHAIRTAAATGRPLLLEPGTHFTTPGRLNTIEISLRGLEIGSGSPTLPPGARGSSTAVVRRPDFSIPAAAPDDNFGLFFVPAAPQGDLSNAVWRPGKDEHGNPFEFAMFIGGSIRLQDLTLDCNMGRQGLESVPDNTAQHSTMLGFAPQWYPAGLAPDGKTPRRAYVVFRNVTVENLITANGAFADDISFVYFRAPAYPIIKEVVVRNITSTKRVGPHRGTIAFGGLPARVDIQTTDIVFLNAESNVDFTSVPRDADVFTRSHWTLNGVKAGTINFGMANRVIDVTATALTTTVGCQIQRVGGTVSNSSLTVGPGENGRFYLLDHVTFDNVAWHFTPTAAGAVTGLLLGTGDNQASAVTFLGNKFGVIPNGTFSSGQLINSVHSDNVPGNSITATFKQCEYHVGFGSSQTTPIAVVQERGTWRFAVEDLHGLNPDVAIPRHPEHPDVIRIVAPGKTFP